MSSLNGKIRLIIIDPQNDFMDIKDGSSSSPALPVSGAVEDMNRLRTFILNNMSNISDILVTLDSHSVIDIAHPAWFVDQNGNNPPPFTSVTLDDYVAGKWKASSKTSSSEYEEARTMAYLQNVKAVTIWPEHCLVGTWGHNIYGPLKDVLIQWERNSGRPVQNVFKGLNPYTEHFSAVKAAVVDPLDKSTYTNADIVNFISDFSLIQYTYIAGEAMSHCVAETVRDLMDNRLSDSMVLLTDCMSSVTGFEQAGSEFLKSAVYRGVKIANIDEPLKVK